MTPCTLAPVRATCAAQVLVERSVQQQECPQFEAFNAKTPVDFAITLGGDGTVL